MACGESTLQNGQDSTLQAHSELSADEVTQGWDAMNAVLNAGTRTDGQALAGFDFDHSFSHACPDGALLTSRELSRQNGLLVPPALILPTP